MPAQADDASEVRYPIGVVARRTGIHPETLRIWERRYAVVKPDRLNERRRLYSEEDVQRLGLVKKLVDAGNPIGQVASLSTATLAAQAAKLRGMAPLREGTGTTCRVAVVGESLPVRLEHERAQLPDVAVCASWREPARAKLDDGAQRPDVVLVEAASVHAHSRTEIDVLRARTGARAAVLVFGFGARHLIDELEREGVRCLQTPVSTGELRHACFSVMGAPEAAAPPAATAQRFDREQLARIAARAPVLACECPRHLTDLISSLLAFETYSGECQNTSAGDAAVHAMLKDRAASARALLETALAEVLRQEGIEV